MTEAKPGDSSRIRRSEIECDDKIAVSAFTPSWLASAIDCPLVIVLDLIRHGSSKAIRAWPKAEALLDQAASELIELRNAAGASYPAACGSPAHLNDEDYADLSSDPGISKTPGIIARKDISADLLQLGAAAIAAARAATDPTRSSAGSAADGRTASGSASRSRGDGTERDDCYDCRTFARASRSGRASQRGPHRLRSTFFLRLRLGTVQRLIDLRRRRRRWRLRKRDLDQLLRRLLHAPHTHVKARQEGET